MKNFNDNKVYDNDMILFNEDYEQNMECFDNDICDSCDLAIEYRRDYEEYAKWFWDIYGDDVYDDYSQWQCEAYGRDRRYYDYGVFY